MNTDKIKYYSKSVKYHDLDFNMMLITFIKTIRGGLFDTQHFHLVEVREENETEEFSKVITSYEINVDENLDEKLDEIEREIEIYARSLKIKGDEISELNTYLVSEGFKLIK